MKSRIILAVVAGLGFQIQPGGALSAQDRVVDVFMDGDSRAADSYRHAPCNDPRCKYSHRADDRMDSRHYADRSEPRYHGDRYESRRGDESWYSSRRGSNDPEAIVRRAYQDILKREPDVEGLRTYRSRIIDDHWSEQDVRSDLRKSDERAGRTPAAAEATVRRAYQDLLGRDPDAAGLATYKAKLLSGGWSEGDVRSDLRNSSERRATGGISNEQAREMVRRAYRSVLERDPDSSGTALYVQRIQQNRWSENDVAKDLRNSQEYRNKQNKK